MFNPILHNMQARIQQEELLRDAAQRRAARLAEGDAPHPVVHIWMLVLSLAVMAVGLGLLAA